MNWVAFQITTVLVSKDMAQDGSQTMSNMESMLDVKVQKASAYCIWVKGEVWKL